MILRKPSLRRTGRVAARTEAISDLPAGKAGIALRAFCASTFREELDVLLRKCFGLNLDVPRNDDVREKEVVG